MKEKLKQRSYTYQTIRIIGFNIHPIIGEASNCVIYFFKGSQFTEIYQLVYKMAMFKIGKMDKLCYDHEDGNLNMNSK